MKRIGVALALAVATWSVAAVAQDSGAPPRVTGQDGATDAEIILNEVNSDAYPEVLILATVLIDGAPVSGLGAGDFRVREDEVDQEPLTVEPQLPPLSVVVAIDGSGSMSRRMAETREAAKGFVASLRDADSAQLLRFARTIDTPTVMTTEKAALLGAIDGIEARGDTALYDALHRSIDLLAERRGRKAVVLLSDGVDDDGTGAPLSVNTISDVLDRAATVNVLVYVIGLGTEMDEAVLRDIAETTGAQYLNAPDPAELEAVYGRIGDQLSGQYAIRYTSSLPADGVERRVDLAALGAQGSKPYTPSGAPSVAAAPAPSGECGTRDAVMAERPDLEQAARRYDEDLISVTERDDFRREAVGRVDAAIPEAAMEFACIEAALTAVADLYDEELVSVTARDDLRSRLVGKTAEFCEDLGDPQAHVACLTFFRDAYDGELISVTARDDLRGFTMTALLEMLIATGQTEESITLVRELYDEELISVTARDDARRSLLDAESD